MELKELIAELNESRNKCKQKKNREDLDPYFRGLVDAYTHILRFVGEDPE